MQDAFGTVVWVVAAVGALIAVYTLIRTGSGYREIGGGGMFDDDRSGGGGAPLSADAERDVEIRQMLEARNARRVRRGEQQQDVEAELAALTRPTTVDDELREEIRQHVLALNERRVRAGGEAVDVDEEIERRIRELS